MDMLDAVDLALDGLNEGYRVIGADLNALLKTKYQSLKIACETKRPEDSIERAREKLKRVLPRLPLSLAISSDLSQCSVWTLGYINGRENQQWAIPLVNSLDYLEVLDFLVEQVWSEPQWRQLIVEPVSNLHAECTKRLQELVPKPMGYSGGDDLLQRDKRIYELASKGMKNSDILTTISDEAQTNNWYSLSGDDGIRDALKRYCLHCRIDRPTRQQGRPRKQV